MSGLRGAVSSVLGMLPERVQMRVNPAKYGFGPAAVPAPPRPPATPIRLYIAPVNFAGQAFRWARAAERLDGVGAVSMQYRLADDFGFPSDNPVPVDVFVRSHRWQKAQFDAVSRGFTHVIVEAGRPVFGSLFGQSVPREVAALRAAGVRVALLSHGSDLRLPSRHREIDKWSPFIGDEWDQVDALERQAVAHRDILTAVDAPVFVSTPDLLLDWPGATWLPVVIDPADWRSPLVPLERRVPVVVHAPSKSVVKGSDLIEPIVRRLAARGLIEYRRFSGVPAAEMPALIADADIVLEQFRIGTYSVAAVEAMAAGRVVVAHVHDQVRKHVVDTTALDVPVVQATPDDLENTLLDMLERRDRYRRIAAVGPAFVDAVHDGAASARVLSGFLHAD
jgi:Glycosyltransferase